jgi:hypothetical protein
MLRIRSIPAVGLLAIALLSSHLALPIGHPSASAPSLGRPVQSAQAGASIAESALFLPLVTGPPGPLVPESQWHSPFGVHPIGSLTDVTRRGHLVELRSAWVRLSDRISWRALQPIEGGPIQWGLLAGFEQELRAIKEAGITPVVIINYFPRWATILPTSCGAIRADKLAAFAEFVRALVARYHTEEFGVHHWEFGNEPDVDPDLVGRDNGWGCWGDATDPFYGGRGYGEMLKVVAPVVRATDSQAQVWIGGLLLARPDTHDPEEGRPELFLQGILEAGAAPYFDVVAYHMYAHYREPPMDYDTTDAWVWKPWGGRLVGKARFLKQLMAAYGVDKPLVANELGLLWCPTSAGCPPPGEKFEQAQADFVVRSLVRAIGAGVQGFFWYPLEGPGYRYSGLLREDGTPKPVYYAYQRLAIQLEGATYERLVDYGAGVEAYAFHLGAQQLHVIWTVDDTTIPITISQSQFVSATDRDGDLVVPIFEDGTVYLGASFKPIYVVIRP